MKTAIASLLLLVVADPLRAGEPSKYEEATKQLLGQLDTIAGVLLKIQDEESAKEATPALKKAAEAFLDARKKAEALPPPERDEKDRLAKLYQPKMEETLKKLYGQAARVQAIPGGREALTEIRAVFEKKDKQASDPSK
jgi:hypothetical protein